MFNDRDLTIMGVGAIAAVICLLIPSLGLVLKGVIAFVVLILFMALALLRMGPDRVPLEVFLKRRIKFATQVRRYTYHGDHQLEKPALVQATRPAHPFRPITLQLDGSNVYWMVTIWLGVIGLYFVIWLQNGGAEEISFWLRQF
ncbi:MAG: hypothetical protein HN975_18730 [Anaerolineae bacterium]|jgi:hypothetical protein|nr:hypothetical protein [Anaerolineae bacterium]